MRAIANRLGVSVASVSVWVRDVASGAVAEKETPSSPDRAGNEEAAIPELRSCGKCGSDLPISEFNRYGGGHQWWCRNCFREYFRDRGALHRQQVNAARRRRRALAYTFIAEYLEARSCADCGLGDPVVLEFDHVGDKRADISRLSADGVSLAFLEAEVCGCDVVCVNCHRIRTARRGGSWRLDPKSIELSDRLLAGERRNLAYIRDLLASSQCADCGLADLLVLEFDHVRGKTANVLDLARSGCCLHRLKEEIARCEIRCANCHRRRTMEELWKADRAA